MKKNETEIIEYINTLKGYEGYIQMSNAPIKDIWTTPSTITFSPQSGFIYEAHFFNGKDSISIRQINDAWYVDETKDVPLTDTRIYFAKQSLKVRMAQIWEEDNDLLCENMPVLKLKKVVFAGFENGGKQ